MSESLIEELDALLYDWEAGTLGEAGIQRVRDILNSSDEARSHYVRHQLIGAALTLESDTALTLESEAEFADAVGENEVVTTPTDQARNRSRTRRRVLAAIAASVICLLAGRVWYLETDDRTEVGPVANATTSDDEATASGIAMVTRLVDIQWEDQQARFDVGDALAPGRLAIKSGFAQIEFFCGATVVVQGPAELDLKSSTLARVLSGRLRAQVPPAARGFSLEVNDMKVVDLGTEFALSVSDQKANVQVFDGEVELHRDGDKRNLVAGEAIGKTVGGDYESVQTTPDEFVDIDALESRAKGQQAERYERWKKWSNELRQDPRLIAYYAFDQKGGWQRKLVSDVAHSASGVEQPSELDGAIVGASLVPGRWNQKKSLEFKRPGDRVRVQIPGEYASLTLACWVKIDSLDRWYNSLFLTDSYNQGEPHWQILDTGQMFFSVRPSKRGAKGPDHQKILSPPFWKPSMSGKWLHLATTYDVPNQITTHYFNGEVLHSESVSDAQLIETTRIGAASIGNWSDPTMPDAEFAIRNLNGSIDEFAMFSEALNADEIKEMFQNGKP